MNLIGYVRISTVKQDSGFSIEDQKNSILAYSKLYGHNIIGFKEDQASGSKKNKGLKEAIKKLYKEDAEGIIIDKLDRLFRNTRELLILVEELKAHNKILISVKEQFDISSPTGQLCLVILSGFAEFERNRIKERVMNGKIAKKQLGVGAFTGGSIKYGLKSTNKKLKNGKKIKILIPDENEQKIISIVKNERKTGKSYREIAIFLNSSDYKTKRGKLFSSSQVFRILKNS